MKAPRLGLPSGIAGVMGVFFASVAPASAGGGLLASLPPLFSGISPTTTHSIRSIARDVSGVLGNRWNADSELRPVMGARDATGTSMRLQHYYQGREVIGSMAVHSQNDGEGTAWIRTDRVVSVLSPASPATLIRPADALAVALSYARGQSAKSEPELKYLTHTTASGSESEAPRAVYEVVFSSDAESVWQNTLESAWIDAQSGQLIAAQPRHVSADTWDARRNALPSTAAIRVYSAAARTQLLNLSLSVDMKRDWLGRIDPKIRVQQCEWTDPTGKLPKRTLSRLSCELSLRGLDPVIAQTCQWSLGAGEFPSRILLQNCDLEYDSQRMIVGNDGASQRAAQNSVRILDYYRTRFGRESYDNQGSPVVSVVHGGTRMENAYWDANAGHMVYGDGAGDGRDGGYTRAIDVAGHEFTHAVVSSTAKLYLSGDAGALNEAYADFFGEMIEAGGEQEPNWIMGTELMPKALVQTRLGLRSLKNPSDCTTLVRGDQSSFVVKSHPAHMSQKLLAADGCNSENDYCYVHANATIPGHASYRIAQAIGLTKAQALIYRTVTRSLTRSETFQSAAQATVKTCGQLYDAATCSSVERIYREQGIL